MVSNKTWIVRIGVALTSVFIGVRLLGIYFLMHAFNVYDFRTRCPPEERSTCDFSAYKSRANASLMISVIFICAYMFILLVVCVIVCIRKLRLARAAGVSGQS